MRFLCLIFGLSVCCLGGGADATLMSRELSNRILGNRKVIFTNVLFRHGNRTPLGLCPNDPMNNLTYWPNEWGQLTNIGVQQQYMLGQWLRQRYNSLLSRTYKPSQIYVRASDVDRTISSALSLLSGLYPPLLTEMWNPDVRWQPIPVHTINSQVDYVMGTGICPKFTQLYADTLDNLGITETMTPFYGYFTRVCGRPVMDYEEFARFYDAFKVEEMMNKPIPRFAQSFYGSDLLEEMFSFAFVSYNANRELARLRSGPLISHMLNNLREKVNGTSNPDRTMYLYSAHDSTIAGVLSGLNLFDFSGPLYHRPGYASALIMELLLDEANKPYVSIVYRNNTNAPAVVMPIPKCGTVCPLDIMFDLFEDIISEDITPECS